ncbi:FG-GAP-like repeat-containing protein, partial [Planctomycetota bacterium]
ADIDADDDDDLVVAQIPDDVIVTNNRQFDAFQVSTADGLWRGPWTAIDVDGDGDEDLWDRVGLFLNEQRTFVTYEYQRERHPSLIRDGDQVTSVADFDGDGRLDILDVRKESHPSIAKGSVEIRYNQLGPELFNSRHYRLLGYHAIDIHDGVPIDFDGDGDLDVAAIGSDVDRGTLYLYENRRTTFGLPRKLPAAPSLTDIESIDLDRDGDFDLVSSDGFWFENDGSGDFTMGRVDEPWYFDLIVRDIDSDGIPEIVSWLPDESRLFVHRIELPVRVIGDSNGDGVFDSSDLVMVFAANEYEDDVAGNSTFAEGDWDGDGDFTSSDLVAAFKAGTYRAEAMSRTQVVDSLFNESVFFSKDRSERVRHWANSTILDQYQM